MDISPDLRKEYLAKHNAATSADQNRSGLEHPKAVSFCRNADRNCEEPRRHASRGNGRARALAIPRAALRKPPPHVRNLGLLAVRFRLFLAAKKLAARTLFEPASGVWSRVSGGVDSEVPQDALKVVSGARFALEAG